MIASVKKVWHEKPLLFITILAVSVRLVSLIFATGYGYHDDHFLVIKPAQSWLDGVDLNYMIVESDEGKISGRSILYPGLHFLVFGLLEFLGLTSPTGKMFVVRILHLLFFTAGIRWAYKLSLMLTTEKYAKCIGIILALFWMFPQVSVRTLVEIVPIPLMMLASLYTVKYLRQSAAIRYIWLAGILLGVCFSLRYQTIFFAGGFGLALLFTGKSKEMLIMAVGVLIPIVLIHGIGDYFICDFPFCKIWYYVEYNIIYSQSYFTEPWYYYTLILLAVLLPPLSFFLIFGFIRAGKIDVVLWSGTLCFLIFHSLFPNKQERFIFSILPHIIILGYIGWKQFAKNSSFWQNRKKLENALWIFFWCFNTILLLIYSSYANKNARIDGMTFLREKGDVKNFLLADPNDKDVKPAPTFYLGKEPPYLIWDKDKTEAEIRNQLMTLPDSIYPNYIIFMQKRDEDISGKEKVVRSVFPNITYLTTKKMSYVDAFRNSLNRHINLDDWVIYQIEDDRTVPYTPPANDKRGNF